MQQMSVTPSTSSISTFLSSTCSDPSLLAKFSHLARSASVVTTHIHAIREPATVSDTDLVQRLERNVSQAGLSTQELLQKAQRSKDAKMRAGSILTINLRAIRHNYKVALQSVGEKTQCAVVLKANGYGLDAARIAAAVFTEGCRQFFVAHIDEAAVLRNGLKKIGIDCGDIKIFVLHGPPMPGTEKFFLSPEYNAIPVLNSMSQITRWRQFAHELGKVLPAVLQFNSGMNRNGISLEEVKSLMRDSSALEKIEVKYAMSHLACAGDATHEFNQTQLTRFIEMFEMLRARFPNCKASLAASPGTHLGKDYHLDLVRLGSFVHGVEAPKPNNLAQVFTLQTKIMEVRTVPADEGVGYGLTGATNRDREIATLSCGFADGLPRGLGNKGKAYIRGQRVPYVGKVSMDTITVDVTGIDKQHLKPGALVDLISEKYTLDQMAEDGGTICADITTKLQARVYQNYGNFAVRFPGRGRLDSDPGIKEAQRSLLSIMRRSALANVIVCHDEKREFQNRPYRSGELLRRLRENGDTMLWRGA